MVAEQDRRRRRWLAAVTHEAFGVGEPRHLSIAQMNLQRATGHRKPGSLSKGCTIGQRRAAVEHGPGAHDYPLAPHWIVGAAAFRPAVFGNGVSAVERVVERPPAGVGGVECVASVHHRYHQLRSGNGRDLGVNVAGLHGEVRPGIDQITDGAQKGLVGGHVADRAGVGAVEIVHLRLQVFAPREQLQVGIGQITDDPREAIPELCLTDRQTRQNLSVDKIGEVAIDGQSGKFTGWGLCWGHGLTPFGLHPASLGRGQSNWSEK